MKPTKMNVQLFRAASVLGLVVCWLLNVFWCLFILRIVPQAQDPQKPTLPSLQLAAKDGYPSTVPLVEILNTQHPEFAWVAYLVAIFIMISISVRYSFISFKIKFHGNEQWTQTHV
jgi:uncharacterized membrane protein